MARAQQQFVTLDALRGIAAIGVMVFHAPAGSILSLPGGYLAVDLFFMMSGFVIAQAYALRMAAGMEPREFLWRRAVRLWPMLALGAVLGIVLHGGHPGALLLLPDWRSAANLYPANPPLWSLLFECLAYAAFAFGVWRLGPRALACAVAGCALVLGWMVSGGAALVDFGAHWHTIGGGLARIGLGFLGGLSAFRQWHKRGGPPRRSHLAWLPVAAMAALMALVPQAGGPLALLALFAGLPAILWAALRWDLPQPRVARALGDLSYPLYCIHAPLLAWLAGPAAGGVAEAAVFAALPLAAIALHRLVDEPVRTWLTQALYRRRMLRPVTEPVKR
jgi:peptidoglycan/LPS O-acetylase OafA/YrhL